MNMEKLKSLLDHEGYYCPKGNIALSQLVKDLSLTDNDNIIIVDFYLREYQLRDFHDRHKLINDMRLEDGVLEISLKE